MLSWTAYDPLERGSTNEDPLGFYAYAMRLADEWLPGITTRTRRVRYYSMVCGGLLLIEEELDDRVRAATNRDAERGRYFMRWERLWAAWNVAAASEDAPGMIGRQKAERLLRDGYFVARSVDYPFIQRQPDLGALGSYRTSLESLGLLRSDCTELKPLGRRLAELYWMQDTGGSKWRRAVESVATGRIAFDRSQGFLAKPGRVLGLKVRGNRDLDRQAVSRELRLVREQLVPNETESRRSQVLSYIERRGMTARSEHEILKAAAMRGHRGGLELERRAAAILALENHRSALMAALNCFRDHLLKSGRPDRPESLARNAELRRLTNQTRSTQEGIRRWCDTAEFQHVFRDFELGDKLDTRKPERLLNALLNVHLEEMRKRRAPRWFHQQGHGRWEIDLSVAYPSSEDGPVQQYSYRTRNLLQMVSETGRAL